MNTLTEKLVKLIIFFLIFQATTWAKDQVLLINPSGIKTEIRLAISKDEQARGLSGLRPKDFKHNEGMLFVNADESPRTFWMNNTYFNLDIIFLDKNLKVIAIEKNVPFHQGSTEPPRIYRTNTYVAQFILETKANSLFSKNLKINDQLNFMGKPTISEIVLKIRQQQ